MVEEKEQDENVPEEQEQKEEAAHSCLITHFLMCWLTLGGITLTCLHTNTKNNSKNFMPRFYSDIGADPEKAGQWLIRL